MELHYLFLAILPAWWLIWIGWTWREDAAKKLLVVQDIGAPHLYFLFGPFGFLENIVFSEIDRFELAVPGFRVIERWARIVGPFWFRVEHAEMTMRDLDSYHWDVWKMMDGRRDELGKNKRKDETVDRPTAEFPDNSQ
jgi:hypothetical protein